MGCNIVWSNIGHAAPQGLWEWCPGDNDVEVKILAANIGADAEQRKIDQGKTVVKDANPHSAIVQVGFKDKTRTLLLPGTASD